MRAKFFKRALPIALAAPLIAAYAGGWATITVETLPEYLVAGQPTNITFSVRQHGFTLLGKLQPSITEKVGKSERDVRAVATNREGYYTATVAPSNAGDVALTIHSGFGNASNVTLLPIPVVTSNVRPVALADGDRGRRLFVAKGCVNCHMNSHVPPSGPTPWATGSPDLTNHKLPADYLERFLANPAIKTTQMPNLNLKPAEITALTAFLNAGAGATDVTARQ